MPLEIYNRLQKTERSFKFKTVKYSTPGLTVLEVR